MGKKKEKVKEVMVLSEFEKKAEIINLVMSDNTPIRVLRTKATGKEPAE